MVRTFLNFLDEYHVYSIIGTLAAFAALVTFWIAMDNAKKQSLYQAWQLLNSSQSNPSVAGRAIAVVDLYNSGQSLNGLHLISSRLNNVVLSGVKLSHADISKSQFSGSNLANGELQFLRAYQTNFSGTCFIYANLRDSQLEGSIFYDADLRGADLSGADLSNSDLSYALLDGADLRGANLSGANIRGASFAGTNLIDANLEGMLNWNNVDSFTRSIITSARNLPAGFRKEIKEKWNGFDSWKLSEAEWTRLVRSKFNSNLSCR